MRFLMCALCLSALCVCTAAASTRARPLPTDCKLSFHAAAGSASLRWALNTLHGTLQQSSTHGGQAGVGEGATGVSCRLQPAAWGMSVCASAYALHCATRSRHALPLLGHLGLGTRHFHAIAPHRGGPDPNEAPATASRPFRSPLAAHDVAKGPGPLHLLAFGHQSLHVYSICTLKIQAMCVGAASAAAPRHFQVSCGWASGPFAPGSRGHH